MTALASSRGLGAVSIAFVELGGEVGGDGEVAVRECQGCAERVVAGDVQGELLHRQTTGVSVL